MCVYTHTRYRYHYSIYNIYTIYTHSISSIQIYTYKCSDGIKSIIKGLTKKTGPREFKVSFSRSHHFSCVNGKTVY